MFIVSTLFFFYGAQNVEAFSFMICLTFWGGGFFSWYRLSFVSDTTPPLPTQTTENTNKNIYKSTPHAHMLSLVLFTPPTIGITHYTRSLTRSLFIYSVFCSFEGVFVATFFKDKRGRGRGRWQQKRWGEWKRRLIVFAILTHKTCANIYVTIHTQKKTQRTSWKPSTNFKNILCTQCTQTTTKKTFQITNKKLVTKNTHRTRKKKQSHTHTRNKK